MRRACASSCETGEDGPEERGAWDTVPPGGRPLAGPPTLLLEGREHPVTVRRSKGVS